MASADVLHPPTIATPAEILENNAEQQLLADVVRQELENASNGIIEISPTGVPKTIYDLMEPSYFLGPQGSETIMVNRQGLKLKHYLWPAHGNNSKCVFAFVHGHGAHIFFELLKTNGLGQPLCYAGSWIEQLNAAGIAVVGIDNQGCGRSEALHGLRFYVESFDDYVNDVIQMVEGLKTNAPSLAQVPVFIGGISLGGCIAYTAAQRRPELFKGAVFLAPMLSLQRVSRQGLNPYMRPLAALLSRLVPAAQLVATDRNTLYPDIQALWDADPLALHQKTRVRNANEYLRATEAALASMPSMSLPFIIFHSENDTMCDCDGSKALYLNATNVQDKTLRLVNSMWHVLVKEEGNEHVLADIVQWILSRCNNNSNS